MGQIKSQNLLEFAKLRKTILAKIASGEDESKEIEIAKKWVKGELRKTLSAAQKQDDQLMRKYMVVRLLSIDQKEANDVWQSLSEL